MILDVGEKALNKVAEVALSTQLDESERLDVQLNTDPGQLAQGKVEALVIDGRGLVMQKDLRLQEMKIEMSSIAVNPMKALAGNLELSEPTEGTAHVILTEADLNRAFNSKTLSTQMENLNIHVDGEPVTIDTQRVDCNLRADGKVGIDAQILMRQTDETQQVSFTTTPRVTPRGRGVSLEDVHYTEGKELSPELTSALVEKARGILNLNNFEMEGISLRIQQLEVNSDKLTLQAVADITHLPSAES